MVGMTPDQLNGFTQMMQSMPPDQMARMMQQIGGMSTLSEVDILLVLTIQLD